MNIGNDNFAGLDGLGKGPGFFGKSISPIRAGAAKVATAAAAKAAQLAKPVEFKSPGAGQRDSSSGQNFSAPAVSRAEAAIASGQSPEAVAPNGSSTGQRPVGPIRPAIRSRLRNAKKVKKLATRTALNGLGGLDGGLKKKLKKIGKIAKVIAPIAAMAIPGAQGAAAGMLAKSVKVQKAIATAKKIKKAVKSPKVQQARVDLKKLNQPKQVAPTAALMPDDPAASAAMSAGPSWAKPAMIGGAALLAVMVLKK